MPLPDLPAREPRSGLVNVVIDTPRGSANKFKYDERLGIFTMSRMLPPGMHFPYDFGSIPGTRAADGDPLDVLVLIDTPTFPGCLVTTRLIGVLRAQQREKRSLINNDRLIGVPETPVNKPEIRSIDELPEQTLAGIENFFVAYNRAQGREFRLRGRLGPRGAERLLREALRG